MDRPELRVAFGEYDRIRGLADGTVKIDGVEVNFHSHRIVPRCSPG